MIFAHTCNVYISSSAGISHRQSLVDLSELLFLSSSSRIVIDVEESKEIFLCKIISSTKFVSHNIFNLNKILVCIIFYCFVKFSRPYDIVCTIAIKITIVLDILYLSKYLLIHSSLYQSWNIIWYLINFLLSIQNI